MKKRLKKCVSECLLLISLKILTDMIFILFGYEQQIWLYIGTLWYSNGVIVYSLAKIFLLKDRN